MAFGTSVVVRLNASRNRRWISNECITPCNVDFYTIWGRKRKKKPDLADTTKAHPNENWFQKYLDRLNDHFSSNLFAVGREGEGWCQSIEKNKYKRLRVVRHINQVTCYTQTITDNTDILARKANGYWNFLEWRRVSVFCFWFLHLIRETNMLLCTKIW